MNNNIPTGGKTRPINKGQPDLKLNKRWVIAQKRNIHSKQHHDNIAVEAHYHVVLANAKRLFIGNTRPFFERNLKGDNQYAEAMHAYMTSSFYLCLECEHMHNYQVHFTFYKCPFEKELRDALKPLIFEKRAKEVRQGPNYPTFYKTVLAFQDKKHIHSL
jgi:hypothetical protein